jgi:hypothetical protein
MASSSFFFHHIHYPIPTYIKQLSDMSYMEAYQPNHFNTFLQIFGNGTSSLREQLTSMCKKKDDDAITSASIGVWSSSSEALESAGLGSGGCGIGGDAAATGDIAASIVANSNHEGVQIYDTQFLAAW